MASAYIRKTFVDRATKSYGPLAGIAAGAAYDRGADYYTSWAATRSGNKRKLDSTLPVSALLSSGTKRFRIARATPAKRNGFVNERGGMPASMNRSRKRRAPKRRKFSKKKKRTISRAIRLTNILKPLPSMGMSNIMNRFVYSGALYNNQGTSTDSCVSWIIAANDIIDPMRTGGTDLSALGVNRLAAMYASHRVLKYGFDIDLCYRSVLSDSSHVNPPKLWFAWRITETTPSALNAVSGSQAWLQIVNQQVTGWRWKALTAATQYSKRKRFRGSIPIRKFFRYPINTLTPGGLECTTPSSTAGGWSSPGKPCYIQYAFFYNEGLDYTPALAPLTTDASKDVQISYQIQIKSYFNVKSDNRQADWVKQSVTTDGDADIVDEVTEVAGTLTHGDPIGHIDTANV